MGCPPHHPPSTRFLWARMPAGLGAAQLATCASPLVVSLPKCRAGDSKLAPPEVLSSSTPCSWGQRGGSSSCPAAGARTSINSKFSSSLPPGPLPLLGGLLPLRCAQSSPIRVAQAGGLAPSVHMAQGLCFLLLPLAFWENLTPLLSSALLGSGQARAEPPPCPHHRCLC